MHQGALVSMTTDGAIRALVGGRDYQESQYDRAVNSRRQPGSSFKPFVYLTALEYGLIPETVRVDGPINIKGWKPENYAHDYQGPVTLQRALALSLNERGLFTWKEWAATLGDEIKKAQAAGDPDTGETYYRHWLATLERIVAEKGVTNPQQLARTRHAWEHACERTPHGTPIELKPTDFHD